MLVIKSIKPKDHGLTNYLFHKSALDMNFLTRAISSAQIILLPTVRLCSKANISWFFVHFYVSQASFLSVFLLVSLFNFLQTYWLLFFTLESSCYLHIRTEFLIFLCGLNAKSYRNCLVLLKLQQAVSFCCCCFYWCSIGCFLSWYA